MEVGTLDSKKMVVYSLKALSNQIKRTLDGPLTGMQYGVIKFIDTQEGQRDIFQKDIEAEFNIRRSTATGILKLMEQKELIKRQSVTYDARLKKLVITPEARQLKKGLVEQFEALEEQIKADISEDELALFFDILKRMSNNLEP